ncbi:MAG: PQQ-binding-like beta-propeller repeat protein, partial [Candidatus Poseidoniaceae archaeon]
MKKIASTLAIIFFFTIVVNAETSPNLVWSKDLDNGYISTSPLIVEDQVFVRTSGFWTGDERPHVYSFNISSGDENWRFKSQTSTQHDMSPLLYVDAKSSACGDWPNMLVVGWNDGKVTALNPENGSLIWEIQTETQMLGITGKMAIDDDALIVPTRTGIGSYCLADGTTNFYADFGEIGWRNGVTVTAESYFIGNENGSLYSVTKSGEFTKLNNFNGKIRHAPIITTAGILIHLQTDGGSKIYLDGLEISDEGNSPAIPIKNANNVYLATSQNIIKMECESSCIEIERKESTSNGEISFIEYNGKSMVSFP